MTPAGDLRVVRLLVDQQNNGKTWPAGSRLAVSKRLGDWWIAQGIAKDSPIGGQNPRARPKVSRGGCNCGRAWK